MECPNCKLLCPPGALRCDCGYDFPAQEMRESLLSQEEQSSREMERATRLTPVNIFISLHRLGYSNKKAIHEALGRALAKLWRR